jgi:DNA-directed RNA polymerase specialized sigma24 family protein
MPRAPRRPHCNRRAASAFSSVSTNQSEALYRPYASAVFRFAWGLCGDRRLADGIVSETCARLLTSAPEAGTQTTLARLLAIARNTYVSGVRRRRREVPRPGTFPGPDVDHASRTKLLVVAGPIAIAVPAFFLVLGR